jgi:hypothetical protein
MGGGMELAQTIVGYVAMATMVAILAGVFRRRLYRVCRTFPVYVAAVLVADVLVAVRREWFTWTFWMVKETTYAVLLFMLALELTRLVFQAFPGALATARRVLLVAVVLILLAVLSIPPGITIPPMAQPRVMNGTALLFAAVWALILWYHLPVHPFHLAIVQGIVPYLLVSTVLLRLLAMWGIQYREWMGLADSIAYVLMLVYWARAVWRRGDPPPAPPSLVRRVQPWRDRL